MSKSSLLRFLFSPFKLRRPFVIGMVHLLPLPGTPLCGAKLKDIEERAIEEARVMHAEGVDGLMVENMWDIPYMRPGCLKPETTAIMTRICCGIRSILPKPYPLGVQVLAGNNMDALAVALAADLDFIRAECFVFAHVADEGLMNGCAGALLRYRRHINAQHIAVLTDIKKKHCSHSITSDVSLVDTARAAEFFMSDGLILTGTQTGIPPNPKDLEAVKGATELNVLIGSGVSADNMKNFAKASGWIVGSDFKEGGKWQNELSKERVGQFMKLANNL